MPDETGQNKGDPPKTSLHAYKAGESEEVEGDPTGQDVEETPVKERGDEEKHEPQAGSQ